MRGLFEDGVNSIFHVLFGVGAAYEPFLILPFTLYQIMETDQTNTMIDMSEMAIGFFIATYFLTKG